MLTYNDMNSIAENTPGSIKQPFWRYLFNYKVFIITFIIWLSLVCQDFYAFTFKFNWIPASSIRSGIYYLLKFLTTFIFLYIVLTLTAYLIKLPALKILYHKKIANIILIIWAIMNLTGYQFLFFHYIATPDVFILKFLHLIAMYSLTLLMTKLIQHFHEPKVKQHLILTIIFCAIGWLFLLLTYPGMWSYDDIQILEITSRYINYAWQHIFTNIFYIVCLQTLPFVFSVIFFQVLLNSLMFSYCIVTLANIFTKTSRQKLILEIILSLLFIFPPVLFHTLGGFRMGIYQFLELYLLTKLIALYFNKEQKITLLNIIEIIFFTVLVGSWRTECFFYPFIVLAILFFLDKERIKRSIALLTSIVSMMGVICINTLNTKLLHNNNYTVISTILPICSIIHEVNLSNTSIEIIDKVIDVELFKKTSLDDAIMTASYSGLRNNYSQTDFNHYLTEVIKLACKYPTIAFNQNIEYFQKVTIGNQITFPLHCLIDNFTKKGNSDYFWWNYNFSKNKLNNPINTTFRLKVVAWINCLNLNKDNNEFILLETKTHQIFYNLLIPGILFVIALIITFVTRNWFLFFPIIALYIHLYLVIFTAPSTFFMYYLSIYLCAYVFGTCVVWNGISTLIAKVRNKKVQKQITN